MFPQIFSGIKITDFSRLLPGPFASMLLQKMGAEVRCVLPPTADPLLGAYSPFKKIEEGKSLVTLDLKTREGLEGARAMIASSSILIEGFRPGTLERLGLGFEAVKGIRPDILYVSIVGYPEGDPKYLLGAHDINFLIDSGIYSLLFSDELTTIPALQLADVLGGFYTAFQILMEWIRRGTPHHASYLQISVVEGLKLLGNYLQHESSFALLPLVTGGLARYHLYKTKDEKRIAVAALEPKFYENILVALELDHNKGEGEEAMIQKIQTVFSGRTLAEWKKILKNVDACISFIPSREEVLRGETGNR